jgi:heptosyltransferase-3
VKSFTTLYPAIQDNSRHMVEVNLDALRRIGIHPQSDEDKHTLLCPVTRQKPLWPKTGRVWAQSKSYILVHPTSRWMFKAWISKSWQRPSITWRRAACRSSSPPRRQKKKGLYG